MNAPEPRRNPTTQVPKTAAAEAKPVGRVDQPTVSATAPAANDPRKASESRRPGSIAPQNPSANPSASRPAAPAVRAPLPPAAAAGGEDEDPEKLLREYAERQKTKVVRLEQQVIEYKKVVAERDSLRAKVDSLGKELQEARKQVEAAAKSDEVIKDLQGKVDAAILSNSILADDKQKLKNGLSQQTEHLKKSEERAQLAEKDLADVRNRLEEQTQGREEAEARVAAAIDALQGDGAPPKAAAPAAQKPLSEAATRPMKATAEPAPAKDEKTSTAPEAPAAKPAPAAKAPAPAPQRPPGRFSFLKK